jgi:decaprenylphospho-beta-D-ribofuranose 2-oxidase
MSGLTMQDEPVKIRSTRLSGWGNTRPARCRLALPGPDVSLPEALRELSPEGWISRGLGRSYGDCAQLDGGIVLDQTERRRLLAFDAGSGTLTAQGGISLSEILRQIVPKGFFLPVSPGTQWVTLGGAVAADVHGKNHHVDGSFGRFVESLTLVDSAGQTRRCADDEHQAIFHATQGGMGLTGSIEQVTLRLLPIESTQLDVVAYQTHSLEETLVQVEQTAARHRYSVSWIDGLASGRSLGRGWVLAGDHAPGTAGQGPLTFEHRPRWSVPFFLPTGLLSKTTCRWFNDRIFRRGVLRQDQIGLAEFFYPLDHIHHWNRIYGRRGFVQYQAVFPFQSAARAITLLLERVIASGIPPFFAGIKSCGQAGPGPLSFLMPGMTIGIDFPYREGLDTLARELDDLVIREQGRVYLAKDSLLSPEGFRAMYPRWKEFRDVCDQLDPDRRIESDQSRRLEIRGPRG